jgi:LysM repeat protein
MKYVFTLLICALHIILFAQETITIEGDGFIVHKIEKGHTLYAISKKYSVSIDDIIAKNPQVKNGLRIGDEILVPLASVEKKAAKDNPPAIQGAFLRHTVLKKETVFSVARKYGVDVQSIFEHNPRSDKGISIGQELLIHVPDVKTSREEIVVPAVPDSFLVHRVDSAQTLFAISRIYGISVDSIMSVNPQLTADIRRDELIRIPKYTEAFLAERYEKQRIAGDTLNLLTGKRTQYNIAVMLPFSLDVQDSIFSHSDPTQPPKLYTLTDIAVEMYRGILLAADSLVAQGANLNLLVYDVGDDPAAARKIIGSSELDHVHLILGPLHRTSFSVVAEFAASKGIHVVSPVPNQKLETKYPTSCTVHAKTVDQQRFLGRYIARMHLDDNVLVMDSEKFRDSEDLRTFLDAYHQNFRGDSLVPLKLDKFGIESVKQKLSKTRKNLIVVPSTDLGFVSDFMNRLSNIKSEDYDIQVVGMEKWLDYHNVDMAYKNDFRLLVPSTSYLNFNSPPALKFAAEYSAKYGCEPGNGGYGLLGFDVAWYFLSSINQHGLGFFEEIDRHKHRGLYVGFDFDNSDRGCNNRHIYILEHKDFNLITLN